jgi:K+-transporting ATPase ATPase C chain
MELKQQVKTSVVLLVMLVLITGIAYPLVITGIGQGAFGRQADGSILRDAQGNVIGSSLIGQNFSSPRYFHPRPSAAGADGYDASASAASNFGPSNEAFLALVEDRATAYRRENGLSSDAQVPVDAVTASASGLDPHITPANAYLQVSRVAKARGLPENAVMELVKQRVEDRSLGFIGEPRVNVLKLNLALYERFGR